MTVLHCASDKRHFDVVESLLSLPAVEVGAANYGDRAPLHLDVNARDVTGNTALHSAAMGGSLKTVKVLVSATGVDIDAKNNAGNTPLLFAAAAGHLDTIEFFRSLPGVEVNARNNHGDTPLHYATRNGRHEAVQLLVSAAARVEVNATDKGGRPKKSTSFCEPLNLFVRRVFHIFEIPRILSHTPHVVPSGEHTVGSLRGVEVNARNIRGDTPLHTAARNGRLKTVEVLMSAPGIEVNATNIFGYTPLHVVA